MHIGIVGPCSSGPLADHLPGYEGLDIGWGGYPIVELVRALIKRGHYVSVVTLAPNLSTPQILTGPSLTYYVYPTRLKKKMRDLFRAEREYLREGILRAKPDILHAHWTYEFAWASLETNLPVVVTTHDNAFQQLRFSKDLYRLGRLYLQVRVLRSAPVVTAVSPYLADSLQWLTRAKLQVVPNLIAVSQNHEELSERPVEPLRIATVLNGWGARKNATVAVEAFKLLRNEITAAELYMYGAEFEQGGAAAKWAASRGLTENIRFCGPLPRNDLLRELKKMSILLHPALEESFGMVILEAMALGLPVIAGRDSGGVRWVLDEGRAGFLTDVSKPEAITTSLVRCIEERKVREQKRRNAYERARSVFSAEAVAAQYENIYEQVLAAN